MKKRLFLAIPLSAPYLDAFTDVILNYASFFPGAKWVRPEHMHVTACFLGGVDEKRVPELREKLRDLAGETRPFTLALDGIGFAPPNRPSTMLWASFATSEPFIRLVERVRRGLGDIPDGTAAHEGPLPHVTLARFRDVAVPIDLPKPPYLPLLDVSSFALFESVLTPSGPRYTEIASFPFSAPHA